MRTIINFSLPPALNRVVEKAIKRGKFATKSEFFRALIRAWEEGQLAAGLEESRKALRAGKGKLLRSLKDLR